MEKTRLPPEQGIATNASVTRTPSGAIVDVVTVDGRSVGCIEYRVNLKGGLPLLAQKLREWMMMESSGLQPVGGLDAAALSAALKKPNGAP